MKWVQPEVIMMATDSLDSKVARSFSASKGGSNVKHQPAGVAILLILSALSLPAGQTQTIRLFHPQDFKYSKDASLLRL
jgi:hypothetical protein